VYKEVSKVIPTLSKTTVYNTLSLFVDAKILRELGIEENTQRYDRILTDHGHFKCSRCDEIYDFAVDVGKLQSEELKGFQTKEINIYIKGLCPKCTGA
jgi:Fe2+ or Zn2+ uptake regulation protein